jgi:uracil-DNA glycosylase family 4
MLPFGLATLREEVVACQRCPRLVNYLAGSRLAHPDYWSRPVPGFGDPGARLLIVGLAPAFHGGNRHGRVFTGDASGAWLWSALHEMGLASAPASPSAEKPLAARGVYVTNVVRCAPPGNRPTEEEVRHCQEFLEREIALLPNLRAVLALGRVAHGAYVRARSDGALRRYPFAHQATHRFGTPPHWLVDSYHPSRQNTSTRRLTQQMWRAAVLQAWEAATCDPD